MTATEELQKAIKLVEQAADILQKSQMSFDFSVSNPHEAQAHKAAIKYHENMGIYHREMEKKDKRAGNYTSMDHHAKQALMHENMHSSLSNNPHHVAYTRTNASGTVSNIAAKGAQHPDAPKKADQAHDEAEEASHQALIDGVHKVGNDLLNNSVMAEHHGNIRNKLEGLKANPTAKHASQVAGDLKLMVQMAKKPEHDFREGDDVVASKEYGGKKGVVKDMTDSGYITVKHHDGTSAHYHHSDLNHHDGWDDED